MSGDPDSGRNIAVPAALIVDDLVDVARVYSPEELEVRLAPLVLVGPKPSDGNNDWAFRTMSLNLVRDTIDGHDIILDASFVVHPLKKVRPGPFASTILIGRSGSNDICVMHASVSKLHARVVVHPDGRLTLSDAGSSNGTFVDSKRLNQRDESPLTPGMVILIGACTFTVVDAKRFHRILLRVSR